MLDWRDILSKWISTACRFYKIMASLTRDPWVGADWVTEGGSCPCAVIMHFSHGWSPWRLKLQRWQIFEASNSNRFSDAKQILLESKIDAFATEKQIFLEPNFNSFANEKQIFADTKFHLSAMKKQIS